MGAIRLQEVAEYAGVSLTTASHALNGKGRVPEATRERVEEAAARLGYRPNGAARDLATGRSMTLAVQISGATGAAMVPESSYFISLINGASEAALELGYNLMLAPSRFDAGALSRLRVEGMILVDPVHKDLTIGSHTTPIVTTGRGLGPRPGVASVDNDHRAAGVVALDHLAEQGFTHPALLTQSGSQSYLQDAAWAYENWCHRHGVDPIIERVSQVLSEGASAHATQRLLARNPQVNGIYATLDRLAVGALLGAENDGRSVGDQFGIVSLSDSPLLVAARPQITAIDLRPEEIGREAARLLVDLVTEKGATTECRIVPSQLRPRSSSTGKTMRTTSRV